jgi:AraC-like DNA-binding protein
MNAINPSELYRAEYDLKFVNCLRQYWRWGRSFSCIGSPKRQSLLIYLGDCSVIYRSEDNELHASAGDVVYCPYGSEYEMQFTDFDAEKSFTVGINFHMLTGGEEAVVSTHPTVFKSVSHKVAELFERINSLEATSEATPANYKALLFSLLSELSKNELHKNNREYSIIRAGYEYIISHPHQSPKISTLAETCYISPTYFRRLFKSVFGEGPKEMMLRLRLERARQALEFDTQPISEIAASLGYYDTSTFIREFKEHYGTSPLQYRIKNKS